MTEKAAQPPEKTFQYDDELPALPLPRVESTFKRLRESLLAVKPTEEQLAEYDAKAAEAVVALDEAQQLLKARAALFPSYLGDWWEEFAYLRNRFPNVLNTNVFCVRDSDFDALGSPNPLSHDPVVRAALMAFESMSFRTLVEKQLLPPEKLLGRHPMCMRQYRNYWTVRKPRHDCDEIHHATFDSVREISVLHRGALFFINVRPTNEPELNVAEIIETLRLGLSRIRPPPRDECVPILTSMDRESWASAWEELEKKSENNRQILERICNSMTTICIDDEPVTTLNEGINRASHLHAHNRWFDRSSLRIVSSNGISMEHGDHTAMDAIVMASTPVDLMTKMSRRFVHGGGLVKTKPRANFKATAYLENTKFDLTSSLRSTILSAYDAHAEACKGIEVDTYVYLGFGRDALRSAKINADAFVQQALQLAFFRDRRRVVPVYESASTRLFATGRTDTIRSLTVEQRAFVEAMDSPDVPAEQKLKLLTAAIKRHGAITQAASTGKGYDRHLMALRLAQQVALRKELPKVFELAPVAEASSYQLLTSQMIGQYFVGGFAHVLDDGYGCCYYLRRNAICIIVSGCSKAGHTDVARFKGQLTQAFHDMWQLVQSAAATKPKL